LDHAIEYYLQLIAKWEEKRNQNVQMIATKERDDRPRVATITCEGVRTRVDAMEQGIQTDQWVKKATIHPLTFDPRRERDTNKKARKELLEVEWVASTLQPVCDRPPVYGMPPAYDHSMT
jgi:hypothetical protein